MLQFTPIVSFLLGRGLRSRLGTCFLKTATCDAPVSMQRGPKPVLTPWIGGKDAAVNVRVWRASCSGITGIQAPITAASASASEAPAGALPPTSNQGSQRSSLAKIAERYYEATSLLYSVSTSVKSCRPNCEVQLTLNRATKDHQQTNKEPTCMSDSKDSGGSGPNEKRKNRSYGPWVRERVRACARAH